MNLDERKFESSLIATLHHSREAKLTFLADRQFKTTVLAVTVDLIAADRLFVWAVNFTDNAKFLITVLLLLFNLLVIFYLFAKKRSYSQTRKEFRTFDRALQSLIRIDNHDPYPRETTINHLKKWFSDGTRMFCMIIIFVLAWAMVALWYNLNQEGKKNIEPNPSTNKQSLSLKSDPQIKSSEFNA